VDGAFGPSSGGAAAAEEATHLESELDRDGRHGRPDPREDGGGGVAQLRRAGNGEAESDSDHERLAKLHLHVDDASDLAEPAADGVELGPNGGGRVSERLDRRAADGPDERGGRAQCPTDRRR
jgi:hypothetical protein